MWIFMQTSLRVFWFSRFAAQGLFDLPTPDLICLRNAWSYERDVFYRHSARGCQSNSSGNKSDLAGAIDRKTLCLASLVADESRLFRDLIAEDLGFHVFFDIKVSADYNTDH